MELGAMPFGNESAQTNAVGPRLWDDALQRVTMTDARGVPLVDDYLGNVLDVSNTLPEKQVDTMTPI
jgi:hypothetical protein